MKKKIVNKRGGRKRMSYSQVLKKRMKKMISIFQLNCMEKNAKSATPGRVALTFS